MTTVEPRRAGRREWIGLAVLALACLLYVMDLTVLHLAVPAISFSIPKAGDFIDSSAASVTGERVNRMRILKEFLEIGKAPEHSN